MPIPDKVLGHLEQQAIKYDRVSHPHTETSQQTAEATHVSGDALAKAVLLENGAGAYILAVLPASCTVHYSDLEARLGSPVHPAEPDALGRLFPDCAPGAIPPFGMLYGLDTVADTSLLEHATIYFEAGDHQDVLGVGAADFRRLMAGASFFSFARPSHAVD